MTDLLENRCLFIPRMGDDSTRAFVAAFRSIGVTASPVPPSDRRTLELGGRYSSGEECYPARITLGDFLKVIQDVGPKHVALFLPTASGPCRFGQYSHYLKQVLRDLGHGDVPVFSPTSADGYDGIAVDGNGFLRTGWRALMATDILRKVLLKTRPYEVNPGETDKVYATCLDDISFTLETPCPNHRTRLRLLLEALCRSRDRLRAVPVRRTNRPLIGVVGEIFCRLNTFSNQDFVRRVEAHGGECWLADITEWITYTNQGQQDSLTAAGRRFSLAMGKAKMKDWIQDRDRAALHVPFREDLRDYEEPRLLDLLGRSAPYLPHRKALGEMVLSVGKAIYLWEKGAAGIADVSPFCCMNGIVCEAVYPRVSAEHWGIPIRVFYFGETRADLDQDIGIFMDLARTYERKKSCCSTTSM
jgi:predicted nucleotide-binding protein (sugar kinase/HSP70/actin superfamily)